MRCVLLSTLLLAAALACRGEVAVEWLNEVCDLGLIRETDGERQGEFKFVNNGTKPIEITEVKPGCGCTKVDFPVNKIVRGDTTVITVVYDPSESPGRFEKNVKVYFKGENSPKNLIIQGVTIGSPETLELFYPHRVGNLYFDTLTVDFEEMSPGIRRRRFIDIYNGSEKMIVPEFTSKYEAVSIEIEPSELQPGEEATITIYLDSTKTGFPGKKKFVVKGKWGEKDKTDILVEAVIAPKK